MDEYQFHNDFWEIYERIVQNEFDHQCVLELSKNLCLIGNYMPEFFDISYIYKPADRMAWNG